MRIETSKYLVRFTTLYSFIKRNEARNVLFRHRRIFSPNSWFFPHYDLSILNICLDMLAQWNPKHSNFHLKSDHKLAIGMEYFFLNSHET